MINEQIKISNISFTYRKDHPNIFDNISLNLPKGIISFIGQNGTGKTTLLLLAAGLMLPDKGTIYINDIDTSHFESNHERQKYVSFIYQNMGFETKENIGDLLDFVYQSGYYDDKNSEIIKEMTEVFELEKILNKKTQEISKGELQRTILAFSLLYGSKIIMMDEPMFAMEHYQKEKALDYIKYLTFEKNISIYCSLHNLDLSKKYSDFTLLFYKDKKPLLGPSFLMLDKDCIEDAFQVPYAMLKTKERMYRDVLMQGNN